MTEFDVACFSCSDEHKVIPFTYFYDSPSALEAVLQAAVDVADPNALQLDSYFCNDVPYNQDDCDTDVVVSAGSQMGPIPFGGRPYMNLSHTGVGSTVTALLTLAMAAANTVGAAQGSYNFVDNNVLNDSSVNSSIACWLAQQNYCSNVGFPTFSASPVNPTMPQYVLGPPADAPASRTQAQPKQTPPAGAMLGVRRRKPMDASNRVEIVEPTSPVSLGNPVELPLTIREGALKAAIMEQRQSKPGSVYPQPIPDASDLSPIVVRDGKQFIKVTPARLGQLQVRIFLAFTDGGLINKYVMLHVVPSREEPTGFWFKGVGKSLPGETPVLYRSLQHPVGGKLAPMVTYSGAKNELRVDDNSVQYSVRSNPGGGVLDFNPRLGTYMPTGVGHAIITGTYGNVKINLCVVVGETDAGWRRKENCSDVAK